MTWSKYGRGRSLARELRFVKCDYSSWKDQLQSGTLFMSGGLRELIPCIARRAVVDGIFMEGEASEVVKVISEIIGLPRKEVQEHLQRIQGSIYHLELLVRMQESTVPYDKQEGIHGESTSLFTGIDDADVEDEYNKIEMEVGSGTSQLCSSEVVVTSAKAKTEDHKTSESLSDALSNLSLVDSTDLGPCSE
ncbi:hypothetical protein Vadar_014420 [Vaccinium darrowii]|uniref:Uncharacterized protein n=1 Tax=Vaccinium darrowii TaxID=229202 RepID=A0ACB7X9Q6_9ERIC|nr:hypothetical protein Vadar_014420 [Vaccinium darrowii]